MTNLTVFDFSDKSIRFERRGDRVWVSLTDMAKASGKLVANYTQLKSTSEFLTEFESIIGIPIMLSNVGGTPETTGTWAIEEVAIDFAAWCSTEIRFVEEKPVANNVALALGYKDPADAIWRKVKPKNKGVCEIQTPGGVQSATVLT